jgi:hypothetical protein
VYFDTAFETFDLDGLDVLEEPLELVLVVGVLVGGGV